MWHFQLGSVSHSKRSPDISRKHESSAQTIREENSEERKPTWRARAGENMRKKNHYKISGEIREDLHSRNKD
jgi:hypothetical protein